MNNITYNTLLVDASYLAYRVYFALPELAPGQTSVQMVYGFLTSLIHTVKRFSIKEIIIVWDHGHKLKSNLYTGYKKKDDVMSHDQRVDFNGQFKLLDNFLVWMGIGGCYQLECEADDVIAHLCQHRWARKADETNHTVNAPILIFSGDHDLYPLLSKDVAMWKSHKETVYTEDSFEQEFPGLEPWQYQEMQALMGCSGDKVPGVRGVGPKRAMELILKYGGVSKIKGVKDGDRLVKLVQANWDAVELSMQLVAFEPVVPVIIMERPDLSRLRKHFFMLSMDALIENWADIENLSNL